MSELDGLEHMFGESEAVTETPATPEPQKQPEAEPAKAPDATAEQPRDQSGRFAPKGEQPAQAAPAEVTPPVQPAQQKPLVDPDQFKGYLEEREKRQAEQARADKLAAELKALREQQSAPPPNFQDDPEGYVEHQRREFARSQFNANFNICQRWAIKEYGKDTVIAALDWGQSKVDDPQTGVQFASMYARQEDPVEWIVKQHKRDQLNTQIGDDPDAWAIKRAAELAAAQGQQPPQTETPASPQPASRTSQPPPTRSLASAQGAGSIASIPMGEFAALDALHNH